MAVVSGLLYVAAPIIIIRRLVQRRAADTQTLLGAIAAYLMAGMAFAFVYRALGTLQAGPFFGSQGEGSFSQDLFFSFTTLTTTGYGNLVPDANPGQTWPSLEMLIGQLFLVTAVARVVSAWQPRQDRVALPPNPTATKARAQQVVRRRDHQLPGQDGIRLAARSARRAAFAACPTRQWVTEGGPAPCRRGGGPALPGCTAVVCAGRTTTVPFTTDASGPQRTPTDNPTAAMSCAVHSLAEVATPPDLALQAGGRWVDACIGLPCPAGRSVPGRGGPERRRRPRPEGTGPTGAA